MLYFPVRSYLWWTRPPILSRTFSRRSCSHRRESSREKSVWRKSFRYFASKFQVQLFAWRQQILGNESNDADPINSLIGGKNILSSHCLGTSWSKISPAQTICVIIHILRQQAVIHHPKQSASVETQRLDFEIWVYMSCDCVHPTWGKLAQSTHK